jgi:hypothetical protein
MRQYKTSSICIIIIFLSKAKKKKENLPNEKGCNVSPRKTCVTHPWYCDLGVLEPKSMNLFDVVSKCPPHLPHLF